MFVAAEHYSRQSFGAESIAPYWVEDIERVRADLDEIDKKCTFWEERLLVTSGRTREHLQGPCCCDVRRQGEAVRCADCELHTESHPHVPHVRDETKESPEETYI